MIKSAEVQSCVATYLAGLGYDTFGSFWMGGSDGNGPVKVGGSGWMAPTSGVAQPTAAQWAEMASRLVA